MPVCAISGCSKTYRAGEEVRMFGLPKVIDNQCTRTAELSKKRRSEWLSRINRDFKGYVLNGKNVKVCQRHFITGKPSKLFDYTNPDWAPTLQLGYELKKSNSQSSMDRFLRAQARGSKNSAILPSLANQQDANGPEDDSNHLHILEWTTSQQGEVFQGRTLSTTNENTRKTGQFEHSNAHEVTIAPNPCEQPWQGEVMVLDVFKEEADWEMNNHIGCQTDLGNEELVELRIKHHDSTSQSHELRVKYADQHQQNSLLREQLQSMTERANSLATRMQALQAERDFLNQDNQRHVEEKSKLKDVLKNVSVDEESLRSDDTKTNFLTGIPSFELLKRIYDFVEVQVPYSHRNVLPKFTEFLLTLMRLRLGSLEQDLAYRFNVSVSAVSRICSRWIRVMSARLETLIAWPERSVLQNTIPRDFKAVFGDRFSVIIDCFEVFINRPSSLSPRTETSSIYKHYNTAKFLIGITPQGTVCFVSDAWGGRVSDKHIILHSGFLDKLAPGDVVLADRGLDMEEDGMMRAKIAIPAFTKGKTQLSFDDIQKTREIANIKIHVEKIIGFIKRKFRILGSILPNSYLKALRDDDTPPIDHIIKICCGLINMCPSLIPYREVSFTPVLQLLSDDE